MYKKILLLIFLFVQFSCSNSEEVYESICSMKIIKGSSFTLCTKFGEPLEDIHFENDTILLGEKRYEVDKNKNTFRFKHINKYFKNNDLSFDDLNLIFINDSIHWIGNTSSETNFFYDNIDYYLLNDSIYHFVCYGNNINNFFGYSGYDKTIRINAEIKITLTSK